MFITPTRSSAFNNLYLFIRPRTPKSFQVKTYWSDGLLDKETGLPEIDIKRPHHHELRGYSESSDIAPLKALFKLTNTKPERKWDKVSLKGVEYIADLKKAIKNRVSPVLDTYAANQLILKATRKVDDANWAKKLDPRQDLASKDLNVSVPDESISSVQESFPKNIRIFVDIAFEGLEKKRRAEKLLPANYQKKKWTVDEAIKTFEVDKVYYVDPAEHEVNEIFLADIKGRRLRMLVGARGSGKSTRLYRLMTQLVEDNYLCFMVSLEDVIVNQDEDTFWATLGDALQRNHAELSDIRSSGDFFCAFTQTAWGEQKVVIFIDDFDKLYDASDKVRNECLKVFRAIREVNHHYALHSIVMCGTFSIHHLNTTGQYQAPFNVVESLKNPYFSLQQTQRLFDEYARDEKITIDHDIVDDIYLQSNGHPGMVCLCGRAIAENIVDRKTKNITYQAWKNFSVDKLDSYILSYPAFKMIINSLLSESAKDVLDLYRVKFAGFDGLLNILDIVSKEEEQADFLTDEGVLLKPKLYCPTYCVSSPLVDSLIRRYVIPRAYPNAPSTPVPKQNGYTDILEVVKESLRFFDKYLIKSASSKSYKKAEVYVNGYRNAMVPRESVYDTELMRVLTNWLAKLEGYTVNGQWHLIDPKEEGKMRHKYSDVIIKKPGMPTVLFDLLATGDEAFVQDHIDKAPLYKKLLKADEAWVIHFTREDEYLKHALWQSSTQLDESINMIHIWHNEDFTIARMSARWKDVKNNIHQIDDQPLAI